MTRRFLTAALPALFFAFGASAHEVWIEPLQWQAAPSETVSAHLRNGEYFKGIDLIWHPDQTIRAEAWINGQISPISGRLGDRPALKTDAAAEGLLVLVHQADYRTITYTDFAKFAAFLEEKGYASVLDRHAARRLPETQVTEAYARFSKSLVAIGEGAGSDASRGLELELVALTNPYTAPAEAPMTVQLFYQGAPLAENKVTVFERGADDAVTEIFLQTDARGVASFPVTPGRTYLVDSVVLREPSRELVVQTRGAVWESLWASLTFTLPGAQ